VSEAKPAMS